MGALCKYELVPQSPTHPPAKNQEYSADAAIFLVARALALRAQLAHARQIIMGSRSRPVAPPDIVPGKLFLGGLNWMTELRAF